MGLFTSRWSLPQLTVTMLMAFAMVVIFIMAGTLRLHSHQFLTGGVTTLRRLQELSVTTPFSSDIGGYDDEEVIKWYNGSACAGRGQEFVGVQPLFDPCGSDVPKGVATWGKYPYMGPHQLVNTSKNPCWIDNDHLSCMPYFYLIGVSKSGTSDLFSRLTSHPQIVHTAKEPHFFDRRRYDKNKKFEKYVESYQKVASAIEKDIRNQGHSKLICGDGSPSYFYDNYRWPLYSGNEHCREPRVILANHIVHLNPGVKLVMIIRHPVNRLYSRYLFDYGRPPLINRKDPISRRQFHSYVVRGLREYRACFQRWSLRHCVYNRTLMASIAKLRIQENLYPVLLEDWLRVVPRDQFIFLRFEDYQRDMASHLRKVYDFLGVDPLPDDKLQAIASQRIMNRGRWVKKTGPMLPETRRLLEDFYQPFIRRFAAMLRDRKFLWEDMDENGLIIST